MKARLRKKKFDQACDRLAEMGLMLPRNQRQRSGWGKSWLIYKNPQDVERDFGGIKA